MRVLLLLCILAVTSCDFGDNGLESGSCGDDHLDAEEGCDDGNTQGGDGCSASCQVETAHPVCGNHVIETGEQCDDGNAQSGDGCSASCQTEASHAVCGNHVVEAGEGCDDGNTNSGDGCSATCQVETNHPVCGNGVIETGEQCDDGNTNTGDGCSSTCETEHEAACTVLPQAGCSGATPACDLADDGTTVCRAVTAQGTSNSHCASDTACKAGYTCVGDGSGMGTPVCTPFCGSDADCFGPGSRCVIDLPQPNPPTGVNLCTNSCNLVSQGGCPSGMGCMGFEHGDPDWTDCRYMGTTVEGDACAATIDCSPGLVCLNDGTTSTCRRYCNVGSPACDDGMTCVSFDDPLELDGVTYGACVPNLEI